MPSHVNIAYTPRAVPVQQLPPSGPSRSQREQPQQDAHCARLAAAAAERGRPLTAEEITLVGEGKPLPPVDKVPSVKSIEERLGVLEASVRLMTEMLIERISALEKNSAPVHMAKVERR